MAQNNYYHFPHGGGPYSGPGYIGQSNMAPGFSGHGPVAASYPPPRAPTGYDQNYGAHGALVTGYGYTPRAQTGAVSYPTDTNQYPTGNPAAMYNYNASSSSYTNTYNSVVTNYAASALYNQQATVSHHDNPAPLYQPSKPHSWNFKKNIKPNKMKTPSKASQLLYCEVCKISCAGPQTYKEHLDGQRHKKKEAQMKSTNPPPVKKGPAIGISLRCELCDVTCTGNDAYAAHIRGSKHQKVLKLHQKLGKPIPLTDQNIMNQITKVPANSHQLNSKPNVLGTPKISFVEGGRLQTIGEKNNLIINNNNNTNNTNSCINIPPSEIVPTARRNIPDLMDTCNDDSAVDCNVGNLVIDLEKNESQPVGQDYVEEIKSDESKSVSFHCKLCDCRFNDPNAKELHLKGRRHRLQYKRKVDPNLPVDIKPSVKQRKNQELKERKYFLQARGPQEQFWNDWNGPPCRFGGENRFENRSFPLPPPPHIMQMPPYGFNGPGPMMGPPYRRGPSGNTVDDNHILQKHSEICPSDADLDKLRRTVSCIERSIKAVAEQIGSDDQCLKENPLPEVVNSEEDPSNKDVSSNLETNATQSNGNQSELVKSDEPSNNKVIESYMRVGSLAKDLVLTSDREVDLVILSSYRPTLQILERIAVLLQQQLDSQTPSKYIVAVKLQEAAIFVSPAEAGVSVRITLTSPHVRDSDYPEATPAEMVKDSKQFLDKQKCLKALAALRRAKWYQANASNLYPCPVIVRLLRDLCWRLPTWGKLDCWAVELLAERVISSAREQLNPGEAFRHILEAIASGLLLPGGAGLRDPCEKDPTDALANLSRQEREEITASAQHALRLIAFRQIHKILAIEPLQSRRKRKHDVESEESNKDHDDKEETDKKIKKEPEEDALIQEIASISTDVAPKVEPAESSQE